MPTCTTERLVIRPLVEPDRERFVGLFGNADFMEFSGGPMHGREADARFDHMLELAHEIPFAKQPIIVRSSGLVVGYTGVGRVELDGEQRLEWGYRLVPEARGQGYATEAGRALISIAREHFAGEIVAMIDPRNTASHRVITKLGFSYWKRDIVNGFLDDVYRLTLP